MGFRGIGRSSSESNGVSNGVSSRNEDSSAFLDRTVNVLVTLIGFAVPLEDEKWDILDPPCVGYVPLLVEPKILGANTANNDRMAGMHAHMMPTETSTVLQTPTGTKSSEMMSVKCYC